MENLNDLIWTDEDSDESSDVSTQGTEMYKACMVAFCADNSAGICTHCGGPYKTASCL